MPYRTRAVLPRVQPIVPTAWPQPFSNPAWLFEPKYDGPDSSMNTERVVRVKVKVTANLDRIVLYLLIWFKLLLSL